MPPAGIKPTLHVWRRGSQPPAWFDYVICARGDLHRGTRWKPSLYPMHIVVDSWGIHAGQQFHIDSMADALGAEVIMHP